MAVTLTWIRCRHPVRNFNADWIFYDIRKVIMWLHVLESHLEIHTENLWIKLDDVCDLLQNNMGGDIIETG